MLSKQKVVVVVGVMVVVVLVLNEVLMMIEKCAAFKLVTIVFNLHYHSSYLNQLF
jgi:hypothetical protein